MHIAIESAMAAISPTAGHCSEGNGTCLDASWSVTSQVVASVAGMVRENTYLDGCAVEAVTGKARGVAAVLAEPS